MLLVILVLFAEAVVVMTVVGGIVTIVHDLVVGAWTLTEIRVAGVESTVKAGQAHHIEASVNAKCNKWINASTYGGHWRLALSLDQTKGRCVVPGAVQQFTGGGTGYVRGLGTFELTWDAVGVQTARVDVHWNGQHVLQRTVLVTVTP